MCVSELRVCKLYVSKLYVYIHADIDAHIHTCTRSYMRNPTYMQTYMRTHSYNVIHIHRSHTLLHTHSSSHLPLTHGLIHTHTLKLIHALTRNIHTCISTCHSSYSSNSRHLTQLLSLTSSRSTHLTFVPTSTFSFSYILLLSVSLLSC